MNDVGTHVSCHSGWADRGLMERPPGGQRLLAAPGDRESCRKGPLKGPDPYCWTVDRGPWTVDLRPWAFGPLGLTA